MSTLLTFCAENRQLLCSDWIQFARLLWPSLGSMMEHNWQGIAENASYLNCLSTPPYDLSLHVGLCCMKLRRNCIEWKDAILRDISLFRQLLCCERFAGSGVTWGYTTQQRKWWLWKDFLNPFCLLFFFSAGSFFWFYNLNIIKVLKKNFLNNEKYPDILGRLKKHIRTRPV